MASDYTAIAALVVALFALLVTLTQLTQQLLATGYVVRKCDQVVAGKLTRGGVRIWHWRQFRFTVRYEAVTFAFPRPLYSALEVSPAILVDRDGSRTLWEQAARLKPRRTTAQACWVSFLQDTLPCIHPEDVGVQWESGDRVPDDLTVAPIKVDVLTVMLLGVASGLQLTKYSPASGEISMSGKLGALTSSVHPVLGGLIHYTPSGLPPELTPETDLPLRDHANSVGDSKGVWANAVFGRFRYRQHKLKFVELDELIALKLNFLEVNGWPADSYTDSIGGAACFMIFAGVDTYESAPPSCVRAWCAHFAEVIVKAHLDEIRDKQCCTYPEDFLLRRRRFINHWGCSSPYLPWSEVDGDHDQTTHTSSEKPHLLQLAIPELVSCALGHTDREDPSSYVPFSAAFEAIMRADRALNRLQRLQPGINTTSEEFVARAISNLAEVGPLSWGQGSTRLKQWPETLSASCKPAEGKFGAVEATRIAEYANLSILRASYFTIMMRRAGFVGPGLAQNTEPITGLAYMA